MRRKDRQGAEAPDPDDESRATTLAAEIGAALRHLRQHVRQEPLAVLARSLGADPSAIRSLEEGLDPSLQVLARHLVALGGSLRDLADAADAAATDQAPYHGVAPTVVPLDEEALTCSFCGKDQGKVEKLIAGPTVFICDECVETYREVVEESRKVGRGIFAERVLKKEAGDVPRCSFCFKSDWEVHELLTGARPEDRICDWCVYVSIDELGKRKPPSFVGQYKIEEKLAGHATGTLYRAWDEHREREVTVKRLIPPCGDLVCLTTEDVVRLEHPSIVPVYAILQRVEGADWIVSAPAEGKTLQKKLGENWLGLREPLETRAIVRLGRQIAEGLAAAHDEGILHRHLTAENVLLTSGRARILDFGLGMPLGGDPTWTGAGLAPLHTLAPEQLLGEPLDERSDLFSLGELLFEAVSGKSPFHDGSRFMEPPEIRTRLTENPRPSLNRQSPVEVPEELEELVDRLLEIDPEDRPQTAEEVVEQLRWIEEEMEE